MTTSKMQKRTSCGKQCHIQHLIRQGWLIFVRSDKIWETNALSTTIWSREIWFRIDEGGLKQYRKARNAHGGPLDILLSTYRVIVHSYDARIFPSKHHNTSSGVFTRNRTFVANVTSIIPEKRTNKHVTTQGEHSEADKIDLRICSRSSTTNILHQIGSTKFPTRTWMPSLRILLSMPWCAKKSPSGNALSNALRGRWRHRVSRRSCC